MAGELVSSDPFFCPRQCTGPLISVTLHPHTTFEEGRKETGLCRTSLYDRRAGTWWSQDRGPRSWPNTSSLRDAGRPVGMSCPAWDSATKKELSVKFLCREHRDGSQAPPSKEQSVEDLQGGPWVHDPLQPTKTQAPSPRHRQCFTRAGRDRLGKQHDLSYSNSLVAGVSGNGEGEWEREGEEGAAERAVRGSISIRSLLPRSGAETGSQAPCSQQHPSSWPSPVPCLPGSQLWSAITLKGLSQKHHLFS